MRPTPDNQPVMFEHIHIKETKENITDTTEVENSFLEPDNSSYKYFLLEYNLTYHYQFIGEYI